MKNHLSMIKLLVSFDIDRFATDYKSWLNILGGIVFSAVMFLLLLPLIFRNDMSNTTPRSLHIMVQNEGAYADMLPFLRNMGLDISESQQLEKDLEKSKVQVAMLLPKEHSAAIQIMTKSGLQAQSQAAQVSEWIKAYQLQKLSQKACIPVCPVEAQLTLKQLEYKGNTHNLGMVGFAFAFILLIAALTAGQAIAIDGLNGDIERKNFGLVLMLPMPKVSIIQAKMLTTAILALFGFVVALISVVLCLYFNQFANRWVLGSQPVALMYYAPELHLSVFSTIGLLLLGLLSALLLAVSLNLIALHSASVRQGQLYSAVLQLLVMILATNSQFVHIELWSYWPVLNVTYAILAAFKGDLSLATLLWTLLTTGVLVFGLYFWMLSIFKKQEFH